MTISGGKFGIAWSAALGVALLPAVLATLPPFLGPAGRAFIMATFAPFCHQLPAYSPHVGGVQLAVGHRIYGVLWGLVLGALVFPSVLKWNDSLNRQAAGVLGAAALPMALDWTADTLGLWAKTPASRLVTGLVFGTAAGYYLARGLVNLFEERPAEGAPEPRTAREPSAPEKTRP